MQDDCVKRACGETLNSDSIYTHIALSLARGYTDLYYVNMDTDEFIEFHTDDDYGVLTEARRGSDFFEGCERDAKLFVHPDDQAAFVEAMNRDFLMNALDQASVFELLYRRIKGGDPFYVKMRVSRMEDDDRLIVIAVADVDEQVKQRRAEERMLEERVIYARLHALTDNFICVYVVNPETGDYREFSATADYEKGFAQDKEGTDFFGTVREVALVYNYPGDIERFLAAFTAENVLSEVEHSGIFTLGYRLMVNGKPTHVQLKAAMVEEKEGPRLIVGINDIDAQVRQEEETEKRLAQAQIQVSVDALTGVKNKYAYLQAEARLNREIEAHSQAPFAIVILDVNNLKLINDTAGHQAGDEHLRRACKIICDVFKHSPVFRVGGDEFAVIAKGGDYERIDELLAAMDDHNAKAASADGVVIACGVSKFDGDSCVASVFKRADQDMYKNKIVLKSAQLDNEDELISWAGIASEQADGENSAEAAPETTGITEELVHEPVVTRANQYDYLTDLPSMTYFFDLAEAKKEAIFEEGGKPAMLYIDFSGMKFFNTKYGFAQGDAILRLFARLLVRSFGFENSCHVAADHFAVITEEAGLEDKLNVLFHDFEEQYAGKTPPVHVGIYPYRVEDVLVSSACDRAKQACFVLKGSYSSDFHYYSAKLREEAVMQRYIVENFDTAIEEKWIQVYLQPIIRSVNERVCDVEALARWVDPEKGILPPVMFIPALEEAGLICKLDLYMVDQVLECIKTQVAEGFSVIPHSINLSRADFDACDIVEEIRKRVDEAGVSRDRVTIEITESVIGSNFEFMKEQVERFQALGFPVWMDDFGSGYSSLDVLQSIKFDLIKFDMSFMRKFDEGEDGKVVLTELMRMATSLGVDTVCEGVETEPQVQFLQEIGCSKLQGYYFSKPVPFDLIRRKHGDNTLIENENPEESEYYESIGRVNLYDLGIIAQEDENSIQNTFDMLPMGIIEIRGDSTRFVRSNQSYRDFVKRFFGFELSRLGSTFAKYDDDFMRNVVKTCCEQGLRSFYDEKMPDGSIVHSFARRIGTNPVTGEMAVVVAVLSITAPDDATSYADIARALAADYFNIYVVDLDTDSYVEYSSLVGGEDLALERHGEDFFESAKHDTMTRVYEGDRAMFLAAFSKENIINELDSQGVFTVTYRLVDDGTPVYVNMKITRMPGGNRIILGVSNVDMQMKQQEEEKNLRQEKAALGRIAALSTNYLVLYTIDPRTGNYMQYSPSSEYQEFGLAKQGEDFYADVIVDAPKAIYSEDVERHLRVFTKENMMREIQENGYFTHKYRLMIDGVPVPVTLKAALVEEEDGKKIILGVSKE